MLWYQQLHNSKSLALIGYSYGKADPAYEAEFQKRFKMTRKDDTVTGALIISDLSLSDSAVYFCAARRHSVVLLITYLTKNLSIKTGNTAGSVVFGVKLNVLPNLIKSL